MSRQILFCVESNNKAGSEVSALLGRVPSAVGYQPTLQTEMGNPHMHTPILYFLKLLFFSQKTTV